MAKPLFSDIVPPDKKNIKKIPIPERSAREKRDAAPERPVSRPVSRPAPARVPTRTRAVEQEEVYEQAPAPRRRTSQKSRKKGPVIFAILSVLLIAFLVFIFIPKATGASIILTPRGQEVSVNASFTASKDTTQPLPYQVAVYQKDGKLTVPASGTEHAETKASGVIRIFNSYSSDVQKLVANTRFATPNGLIFRISQPITVPGMKGSTPGSVDVAVTADKVGAEYNVGLSDFTIPGFQGDPKYTKVYARSVNSIAGGFSGNRPKVDDAQVASARQKIRDELQASLIRQMEQNIPDDFIFPQGAYFIEYESLPDTAVDNGAQLTERATFHGIMFKRADLAQAISSKVTGSANSTNTDVFGTDNLIFSVKNANVGSSTKPWDSDPLAFNLTGTTTLISNIDTDKLTAELAGKPRKSLNAILAGYPGVAKAQVMMRPFWKQSFPADTSEITITVTKSPISQ